MSRLYPIMAVCIAISIFATGWYLNGTIWERRSRERLNEQHALLTGACNDRARNLKGVNDDLQKKLGTIRTRYYDSLRLQPVCVRVDTGLAEHSPNQ